MVAVVTDSASNIPPELADELGVRVVPMYLSLGGRTYRDGVDIVGRDFYERLVRGGVEASTSTPNPSDFAAAFESTGEREIVCVTVASRVSAIHQEASLAAERFGGRIEVVDSGSASMGEGFVALEAGRAAARGEPLETVAERSRHVAGRVRLVATIDTFEFLRRSGRVTKLQAWAATTLDIKPVFSLVRGEIGPVGRPRTRARALVRIVDEATGPASSAGGGLHVAAFHANAPDDAHGLLDRISGRVEVVERVVSEFTPAMGAHTGPGLVGVAYWSEGA
ncbi:MAG: DegV family protein [Actinobacteria bacterium]|nr:DegV family protein [Actinomycetota bacterium]